MKIRKCLARGITYRKVLSRETINPSVEKAEYAVRGYIPTLAGQLKDELKKNPEKFNFKEVVELNIGNPLLFDTNPMWAFREMTSALLTKGLSPGETAQFLQRSPVFGPMLEGGVITLSDVTQMSTQLLNRMLMPSFSTSSGWDGVKTEVARAISQRDGDMTTKSDIFLSNGASTAIRSLLELVIDSPKVGIMTPIPQYPLYSGLITLLNGQIVPYELDEQNDWNVSMDQLKASHAAAKARGVDVRAIVLINPGNPTGNIFDRKKMEEILRFSHQEGLVVLADEVYQENIYTDKPWVSFRKALKQMEAPVASGVELVSFHSLSKGICSECGLRGGYMHLTNVSKEFREGFKSHNANNWPNNIGQGMLMVKSMYLSGELEKITPPGLMDAVNKQYKQLFESLKYRAQLATKALNSGKGISCNKIEGAMYAFPRIELPPAFIQAAEKAKLKPDVLYCKLMLEKTGICLVPGSGFGQKEGTFHFRTTILPQPDSYFEDIFNRLVKCHEEITGQ